MATQAAVDAGRRPVAILVAATVGCGLSACSGGGGTSPATVSAHPPTTVAGTARPHARQFRLPSVGVVVVTRRPDGLLISDRATHGKRFSLSGLQAGECLNFLRANPGAPKDDVRAACPGEADPRGSTAGAATSTGP